MSEKFLSDFVRQGMKHRGWSLRRTARELRISPSYLSLILNHHVVPQPAVIEKIARGFDVSYSYLFVKTGLFKDGPFKYQVRTALLQVNNDISFVADVLTQFAKYFQVNDVDAFVASFLSTELRDEYFKSEGDRYKWVKLLTLRMHDGHMTPQTGGVILSGIEEFIKHENMALVGVDLLYYLFDCIPAPFFNESYAPLFAELLSIYSKAFSDTLKRFKELKTDIRNFSFPKVFQDFFVSTCEKQSKTAITEEEVLDTNLNVNDNNVSEISEINISTSISGDKASITITVPRNKVDTLLAKILNLVK